MDDESDRIVDQEDGEEGKRLRKKKIHEIARKRGGRDESRPRRSEGRKFPFVAIMCKFQDMCM